MEHKMQAAFVTKPYWYDDIFCDTVPACAVLLANRQSVPQKFRVAGQLHRYPDERVFSACTEELAAAYRGVRSDTCGACTGDISCAVLRYQMGTKNTLCFRAADGDSHSEHRAYMAERFWRERDRPPDIPTVYMEEYRYLHSPADSGVYFHREVRL